MLFTKETIKSFAASKGITQIEDSVFQILSQDLEYRVKELTQEASKFMYASRRVKLTIDDINYALESRNIDPLFGYDPNEPLNYKSLSNFYYQPDEDIDLEDFLNKPLPKIPLKPIIQAHWLAIEGITPSIPENISKQQPKENCNLLKNYIEDTEIKATTKHVLTKELQLYYDKINNFMKGNDEEQKMAFECLENDSGIQQLIPYFIHTFYEKIISKENVKVVMKMLFSIVRNKYIFVDPYLHQIIPAFFSCLLGENNDDDGKNISCDGLVYIFEKFASVYGNLGPRILNILYDHCNKENESNAYFCLRCFSMMDDNVKGMFKENYGNQVVVKVRSERVCNLLDSLIGEYE